MFAGEFSRELKSRLAPSRLLLVDLFKGIRGSADEHGNGYSQVDLEEERAKLQQRYAHDGTVEVVASDTRTALVGPFSLTWLYSP